LKQVAGDPVARRRAGARSSGNLSKGVTSACP
jgi:hypothetical protein